MSSPVFIVLTVELSNGHFKSSLKQPLDAPMEEKKKLVEKWFELIKFGLESKATEIEAVFAKEERKD